MNISDEAIEIPEEAIEAAAAAYLLKTRWMVSNAEDPYRKEGEQ